MKIKYIAILLAGLGLAGFLLGAATPALYQSETDTAQPADRLIGVFLTTEHLDLFDAEGYLLDNAGRIAAGRAPDQTSMEAYQGRLYATLASLPYTDAETGETTMTTEYVFEGVSGIRYFIARYTEGENSWYGTSGDEAVSDGHMAIAETDAGADLSLEGTIYAAIDGGATAFYYNPVYQTAAGEVYVTSGSGMSYGGDLTPGMSGSHTLSEKQTATAGEETASTGTEVKISISYIDRPQSIAITQFDGDNRAVSQTQYAAGELPHTLVTAPKTAYLLVETRSSGGTATRQLFQPGDETLSAFYCREDGICVQQWCSVTWPEMESSTRRDPEDPLCAAPEVEF